MKEADGIAVASGKPVIAVDPELGSAPVRRRFSDKEKLRILAEADAAAASGVSGAIGALLRRESIYSSMLTEWLRQREAGNLCAKRGQKAKAETDWHAEADRLRQENDKLRQRLAQAEKIIDVQKKVSELLSMPTVEMMSAPGSAS